MDDTAVGAMSLKESGENMTDGDMNGESVVSLIIGYCRVVQFT